MAQLSDDQDGPRDRNVGPVAGRGPQVVNRRCERRIERYRTITLLENGKSRDQALPFRNRDRTLG